MLQINTFLKENPILPDFIKNHKAFQEIDKVKKIFPSIGLSNFTVDTDIKNTDIRSIASTLIYKITYSVTDAEYFLSRRDKDKNLIITKLLRNTSDVLNTGHVVMLKEQENTGKLSIIRDILDHEGKVFLASGTSIFKVYARLAEVLVKDYNYTSLTPLDQTHEFKEYSANNVSGKMQIVFSGEEKEGAWDLATMSMRGIRSCQSWDGQYKECLIGSITDPYTAIIYTTSGSKGPHGTKMIRRCIVRFVINKETAEQLIFLDKMYPAPDTATMAAFHKEIASRISPKIKIIDHYQPNGLGNYFIPNNPWTHILLKYRKDKSDNDYNISGYHNQHNILSYRDSLIEFRKKPSVLELLEKAKEQQIFEFKNSSYNFISSTTHLSYQYTSLLEKLACKYIFEPVVLDDTMYPSTILRKSCINYFKSTKTIVENITKDVQAFQKKTKNKSPLLEGVGYLLAAQADNKIVLKDFIENNFKEFISSYMMDLWNSSIQKPKPKRKSPRKTAKK